MDEIKPVSNPGLQYKPPGAPSKIKDKDAAASGKADKVELALAGKNTAHRAMLIYQKAAIDIFINSLGLEDKSKPAMLTEYRTQAADGMDDLSPDNWTPEKVAGRILKFALGLFDLFKSSGENDGLSDDELLDKFKELVTSSIDKGYGQALGVLGDVPSEITSQLGRTMEIVQAGIDDWYNEQRALLGEGSAI